MYEMNMEEVLEINGGAKVSTIFLGCASIAACFAGPAGVVIGIGLAVYSIAADDDVN